jgi:hypothetical protein
MIVGERGRVWLPLCNLPPRYNGPQAYQIETRFGDASSTVEYSKWRREWCSRGRRCCRGLNAESWNERAPVEWKSKGAGNHSPHTRPTRKTSCGDVCCGLCAQDCVLWCGPPHATIVLCSGFPLSSWHFLLPSFLPFPFCPTNA